MEKTCWILPAPPVTLSPRPTLSLKVNPGGQLSVDNRALFVYAEQPSIA